ARKANKEQIGIISAQVNMSVVLNNLNRYNESVVLLKEALDLSREMQDMKQMRSVYGMLSETYEKMGDVEQSLVYFNLYRSFHEQIQRVEIGDIQDALDKEKTQKELAEAARIKGEYELLKQEFELKEQESIIYEKDSINRSLFDNLSKNELVIRLLTKEKEVAGLEASAVEQRNLQLIKEKMYIKYILIIVILAAIGVGGLIAYNLWVTKKHNRIFQKQNEDLIAKNKHIEEQRKEIETTQDKLVISEKMATIGAFTAGIAHELNNSCNYIAGSSDLLSGIFGELIEREGKLDVDDRETVRELSAAIRVGVDRMKKIISELRARQFSLDKNDFVPLNLLSKVQENIEILSSEMIEGIHIETICPDEIYIEGIETQINHLLYNLLSNSTYVLKGKQEGKIVVTLVKAGAFAEIKIYDNGIGIPKENRVRVFDPFFTTKDVGEGTGLGLYTVYYIVSYHGGDVRVDSEEGAWTEFTIHLPLVQQRVDGQKLANKDKSFNKALFAI
ncbi:MAG: HAMP domain-containing histidine kinase, partial [Cyclobacteriaceae bacterium]|nr:HAMP domain-containing histidine kinase [Cyclobacteriaceae bacterium]